MRPGQNKRMRGRNNNNRKGPNPLTRSYESNGPDVKIRGTAHHIGEKYLQLARDAQSSGDPVMAESYLQHAEHYFRLIAAAQQAQQQAQFGYQRQPGDPQDSDDEDGDDDFVSLPDRFASPGERQPQAPQTAPQPYLDRQPFSDRQPYDGRQDNRRQDSQGYQGRQDHQGRQDQNRPDQNRQDQTRQDQTRQDHQNRQQDHRNGPQPGGFDRQGGDRQPYEARDRQFDNRRSYQDRNNQGAQGGQDHQDRGGNPDRQNPERQNSDRQNSDRNGQDRPPRDSDNRGFRNRNREFRDQAREPREARQSDLDESTNGLPAFITAPSRAQPENDTPPEAPAAASPDEATEDSGQHMRPRRRRRTKADFAGSDGQSDENRQEAPTGDPVGD